MTISKNTTLILGAGSSVHCGFPLGIQLINDIARMHNDGQQLRLPSGLHSDDVKTFIKRLSRSAHYSIDAFLETVPGSMDIGKYLIASRLKRLESVDRLFPPHDSGWYQYLFNCLVNNSEHPFDENKLCITTFNYDRSLEAYLFNALKARYGFDDAYALAELEKVPIIHVHGSLGPFPETDYEPIEDAEALLKVSKSIKIISEIKDAENTFCSDEFRQAHEAIIKSERVIFLGFGFHQDNVRRLKVNWSSCTDKEVWSTFTSMSDTEYQNMLERLQSFGMSKDIPKKGTTHGCNDFFRYNLSLI